MQLEDLLAVRPSDGATGPIARRVAPADGVHFPLVAAQQLPELFGVWQEEGSRVCDAQEQQGEDEEPGHGGAGRFGTSAVWIKLAKEWQTVGV